MSRKGQRRIVSPVPLVIKTDIDGDLRTYISHALLSDREVTIRQGYDLDDEPGLTPVGRHLVEQLFQQLSGIKVMMVYGRELYIQIFELVDWYRDGYDQIILGHYASLLILRPKRQRLAVDRRRQIINAKGKTVWIDDDEEAA